MRTESIIHTQTNTIRFTYIDACRLGINTCSRHSVDGYILVKTGMPFAFLSDVRSTPFESAPLDFSSPSLVLLLFYIFYFYTLHILPTLKTIFPFGLESHDGPEEPAGIFPLEKKEDSPTLCQQKVGKEVGDLEERKKRRRG